MAAAPDRDLIVIYTGYGTPQHAVVEGRVIKRRVRGEPGGTDSRWLNLSRTVRQLSNRERKHSPLVVTLNRRETATVTDSEGYFKVVVDADWALSPGWHSVGAHNAHTSATGDLLIVPEENRYGVISDLDDTLLITDVTRKVRMLRHTFFRNALQRQLVPGMVALFTQLRAHNPQPECAPLFYLSASPRQLHISVAQFIAHHGFPRGVLLTKRITNDRTSEPLLNQFAYKQARIAEIVTRLPHVRFTLVGDDGESDPEIYAWVRQTWPDRVDAVWIRRVRPLMAGPSSASALLADQRDLADVLREKGLLDTGSINKCGDNIPGA